MVNNATNSLGSAVGQVAPIADSATGANPSGFRAAVDSILDDTGDSGFCPITSDAPDQAPKKHGPLSNLNDIVKPLLQPVTPLLQLDTVGDLTDEVGALFSKERLR